MPILARANEEKNRLEAGFFQPETQRLFLASSLG
jgi:hypothetical protein